MAKDRQASPNGTESSIPKSYSERRKMKKVQVERHRRERINRSMGALRDLLCQGRPEMAADIDRAQILELAVSVIRHYQQTPPTLPNMHPAPPTSASYRRAGYTSATTAITTHMDSARVDPGLRTRLLGHLAAYQDVRYNMTSSQEHRIPATSGSGAFLPVQTIHDVTHKTGPLYVECGARNDVISRDISRDNSILMEARMGEDSPRSSSSREGLVVDENNNNDMWRPW